jgi:thioredoxin-like negative regulator of GroEL
MIDFYAPWCGHCMKMTSEWNKFATQMKGSVHVAKIDASEHSKFNDAYGLKGFPHIVFLPAGKKDQSSYFTHTGTRTAEAFEKWVTQKIDEHKRLSLEKLTDEQKWAETCLGPHSDFCTIFFLPNITDSSEEEHDFYLKTIKGVSFTFKLS